MECTESDHPAYIIRAIRATSEKLPPDVHPAKIQIRLHICAVWSISSLGLFWIAKEAKFLHAVMTDQTAWKHMLIWVVYAPVQRHVFSHCGCIIRPLHCVDTFSSSSPWSFKRTVKSLIRRNKCKGCQHKFWMPFFLGAVLLFYFQCLEMLHFWVPINKHKNALLAHGPSMNISSLQLLIKK